MDEVEMWAHPGNYLWDYEKGEEINKSNNNNNQKSNRKDNYKRQKSNHYESNSNIPLLPFEICQNRL